MNDDAEEKYEEMNRAERRAKKILKKNNYRSQHFKRCATCKKSNQNYPEEDRTCDEAHQEGWMFGEVEDSGICDLYEGE